MNDDFLHKIRVEPPARFIAALKARLDRQNDPRTPNRRWLRNSIAAAVIGAAGLAAAVMVVNSIRDINPGAAREPAVEVPGERSAAPGAAESATGADASSAAASTIQRAPASAAARGAEGIRILGPPSLTSALKEATRILNISRPFNDPAFTVADADSALASLCNLSRAGGFGGLAGSADAVGVTRRISSEELKRCEWHGRTYVAEIKLGHEAVALVRSKLYPAPKLTARDLFLALAREIPDPDQPQRLIRNPNASWGQVDPGLLDERIDISGPAMDTDASSVFREFLMEPGCSTFPSLAAMKERDRARYESVCKTIRTDGVYHGMNSDLFGQLEAHPEALALVDFRYFLVNGARLNGASIDAVEPISAEVIAGTYPGSRTLYLYVNIPRAFGVPRMRDFVSALQESIGNGFGSAPLVITSDAERREGRTAAMTLQDVKL
jgi:phosphate transport system substrate-binding protein